MSVNGPGNPLSQSWKQKEGYGGKDLQKRKVLSLGWKSGGDEWYKSGESMEPMEEVPLIRLGESEFERLVRGWRPEVDSRDEGRHIGTNDLLYVEKVT